MLTKITAWFGFNSKKNSAVATINRNPSIIPRSQHNISRRQISRNALKVLYRLKKAGYEGYLVGGGIRDLLLGIQPKDFDIVTDALPEEVRRLFRNCRLIGRRFRLAHIYFGNEIIEVATFRATHDGEHQTATGMLLRDNVYGNIHEDVLRRDFTINAIYYNILDFTLVDYVNGLEDINKRQLKIIGDPIIRYREDPVRMLRAIRFANKLNLNLHKDTEAPLFKLASFIKDVAPARLFEEYLKLFLVPDVQDTFAKLIKYGLYAEMFPQVVPFLKVQEAKNFIETALLDTNKRINAHKSVSPVFLLAVFLWYPFLKNIKLPANDKVAFAVEQQESFEQVIALQKKTIMFPKRFTYIIKDLWLLQFRLVKLSANNIIRCYKSPVFRMAYDFLLLRAQTSDEEIKHIAKWWQDYMHGNKNKRQLMLKALSKNKKHIGKQKHKG